MCGQKFIKKPNCSRKEWDYRKFCSRKCIHRGQIAPNRKYYPIGCLTCNKEFKPRVSTNRYCSKECSPSVFRQGHKPWHDGTKGIKKQRKWTENEKQKIADRFKGDKSHFWKGGRSRLTHVIRQSFLYRNWRRKVYERDNYTCVLCGQRSGKLNCDHIKPFSKILDEYKITHWSEAKLLKELWDISNGRTLCISCHTQTDTYAKRLRQIPNKNMQ